MHHGGQEAPQIVSGSNIPVSLPLQPPSRRPGTFASSFAPLFNPLLNLCHLCIGEGVGALLPETGLFRLLFGLGLLLASTLRRRRGLRLKLGEGFWGLGVAHVGHQVDQLLRLRRSIARCSHV